MLTITKHYDSCRLNVNRIVFRAFDYFNFFLIFIFWKLFESFQIVPFREQHTHTTLIDEFNVRWGCMLHFDNNSLFLVAMLNYLTILTELFLVLHCYLLTAYRPTNNNSNLVYWFKNSQTYQLLIGKKAILFFLVVCKIQQDL